ncbi:hypothetical protein HQ529_05780 [Candidatus Woesearchaeota archaeon]|nr:hypothetical protein [Candidatus Woesearchaeota archaeon]
MWKKLSDSNDIISYEKNKRGLRVRIEARLNENSWHIYKTYFNNRKVNFVEEYNTSSKKEAKRMINSLTKESDLTSSEIRTLKKLSGKKLDINIKRAYKEYDVEKWYFSLTDEIQNFITVRFGEDVDVDIVMHEHYRFMRDNIINDLVSTLGLDKFNMPINQRVYFFNKKSVCKSNTKDSGVVIGKIQMDFKDN